MTRKASSLPCRKSATSCSSDLSRSSAPGRAMRVRPAGARRAEASNGLLLKRGERAHLNRGPPEMFRSFHQDFVTILSPIPDGRVLASPSVAERSIVVVEDETAIAEAVAARLRSEGYVVETA